MNQKEKIIEQLHFKLSREALVAYDANNYMVFLREVAFRHNRIIYRLEEESKDRLISYCFGPTLPPNRGWERGSQYWIQDHPATIRKYYYLDNAEPPLRLKPKRLSPAEKIERNNLLHLVDEFDTIRQKYGLFDVVPASTIQRMNTILHRLGSHGILRKDVVQYLEQQKQLV